MIPPPVGLGRDTTKRRAAREALERVLWSADGARRLPRERELVAALEACDPRDAWWTCEMSSFGPAWFLPTREWVRALVKELHRLKARRVLEVAAGDGFLSRSLASAAPDLDVIATDDESWSDPRARMTTRERRELRDVAVPGMRPGGNVLRLDALRAVRRFRPDVVLVAWAPPGDLVERVRRAPCRFVLELGTEGDECGLGPAGWSNACDLLTGPIESRALCRLDARPREHRASRVTLYAGALTRPRSMSVVRG